jgi:signal transduction histidine kinase
MHSSASQTHTAHSARRQSTTGQTNLQLRTTSNPKDVLGGLHEKVEEKETSLSNDFKTHSPYSKYKEKEIIVVRIEVQDTGVGIRPKDMQGGRLFSAYVQTEIGKKQGGKGTGCEQPSHRGRSQSRRTLT